MRECIVPLPQRQRKYPNAQENTPTPEKNTPSFPRRRESTIPAHAGMHRPTTPTPEKIPQRPRKYPNAREKHSVIPAKAGIHNSRTCGNSTKTPSRPTRHIIPTQDYLNVIPAKAGIHKFPRTRECIVPLPQRQRKYPNAQENTPTPEKNTPSFPRRRESTIPAHAGMHRPTTPTPEKIPQRPRKYPNAREKHSVIPAKAGIHNSRARGNSTKTPSRPTRHIIPTQDYLNVIPAKAGIHKFPRTRECIVPLPQRQRRYPNAQENTPTPEKNTPSFPRRRESTIPAHAGIQRKHHPDQPDTSFPHRTTSTSFAKAGLRGK